MKSVFTTNPILPLCCDFFVHSFRKIQVELTSFNIVIHQLTTYFRRFECAREGTICQSLAKWIYLKKKTHTGTLSLSLNSTNQRQYADEFVQTNTYHMFESQQRPFFAMYLAISIVFLYFSVMSRISFLRVDIKCIFVHVRAESAYSHRFTSKRQFSHQSLRFVLYTASAHSHSHSLFCEIPN